MKGIEDANDRIRLYDLAERYENCSVGEENRFLERSRNYLEHFIEEHSEHDNTPSQSAWAKKLSEDCATLSEYRRKEL